MSSQQPFTHAPPIGEVQHIHFLSEHIGALYLNDEYSDVSLIVENSRFNAHKVILAARSEYFRALLFGGLKESTLTNIELKDTPLNAFKHLLRYIYMGHMSLSSQKDKLILEILEAVLVGQAEDLEDEFVLLAAEALAYQVLDNMQRALLFGGLKESTLTDIELKDTPLNAFKHLLRYIYMGHMSLGSQKDELILEILGLAHKYGFQDLEAAISDYLKAVLSIKNVCLVYDTASLYGLEKLVHSCCFFMDRHAVDVIQHESFSNLSADCVRDIISRDSFCAPEVEIFKAVCSWVKLNEASGEECAQILSEVRLSLITTQDLLKTVRPTSLVQPDILLDAIQSRTESRDMELKYRGYLIPEENVATPKHGAIVIGGEVKSALLDGDSSNYDMERGFTRHPIDDTNERGIIVKLGMQCIINHFRMLLWDKDNRSYSYYIEVSMDQKDWVRVVDHTKYLCRSWQDLYFSPRVVRFIRIVGTYNSLNKVFHVVSLEAYYTKKPFQVDKQGILVPKDNVATIDRSAIVLDGVSRSRHALLNGDTSNYDWDSGYTCHQLGSGAICVQLGQPYAIESMKLLLWDCDDRSYSYYIEVSNNKTDWEVVWDRSKQYCQSWQLITFPRRPIVYIRIVGTYNTANEVFHCVHFECPAVTNVPKGPAAIEENDNDEEEEPEDHDEDVEAALEARPDPEQYDHQGGAGSNFKSFEDTFSHMSQHSSPSSHAGSTNIGHLSMPMGASACSMARASQYPESSHGSSSPVMFEAVSNSREASRQPRSGSAHSLPNPGGGLASKGTSAPARAVSVDEASLALANLLEMEPTPNNANNSFSAAASRRVYQHALSVRVPANNHGSNSGAVPRRHSNKAKVSGNNSSQNNNNNNNQSEEQN